MSILPAAGDIAPAVDSCELLARARQLAVFSSTAANTGNTIVIFSMLVLQKILAAAAVKPTENLTAILEITTQIAMLNNSLKILP